MSDSDEKACYCDSRQCDICTPEPRGDLKAAVQMLAADNARMCDIIIAADKLADTLAGAGVAYGPGAKKLNDALAAYKAMRNGQ